MTIYEKRFAESARRVSQLLGVETRTKKGGYSKHYDRIQQVLGGYPLFDHVDEIKTKSGKTLGVVIQPYADLTDKDIADLKAAGYSVAKMGDPWHAPNAFSYFIGV